MVLRTVVMISIAERHAGLFGDRSHRRPFVSAIAEQIERAVQDERFRLLTLWCLRKFCFFLPLHFACLDKPAHNRAVLVMRLSCEKWVLPKCSHLAEIQIQTNSLLSGD